jgi:ribose transport system substrate-binding protein
MTARRLELLGIRKRFAGVVATSGAWAATPLAKECGPNNDYLIGFSQANFKEPFREHVNHELERLV